MYTRSVSRSPWRWLALFLVVGLLVACGDDSSTEPSEPTGDGDGDGDAVPDTGPFTDIEPDETLRAPDLSAQVDIVRDSFGVAHVYAANLDDLMFANGYQVAADRLAQMDLFRRVASGRIAELFGTLDASTIASDLEMRMHRLDFWAARSLEELRGSSDESDQELVRALDRYADGVNAYVERVRAGEVELDPAVDLFFNDETFPAWTAADSLAVARLQAWNLSFNQVDITLTDLFQVMAAEFAPDSADPDRAARAGLFSDLVSVRPIAATPTIDGFPNAPAARVADAGARPREAASSRPQVPQHLLDAAREVLRPRQILGFTNRHPDAGSNNWVVSADRAGGAALMANDPHLGFASPSIFYPVHLVAEGDLELHGVAFPGIPGIILGRNGRVAWGGTVSFHDVTDVYLESIAPCAADASRDCVDFDGGQVEIEDVDLEIDVGFLGDVVRTVEATYEFVPHHGPIIPTIVDGGIEPRTGNQALSVRYTGYQVTQDIRAIARLWRAQSVGEAIEGLEEFAFGSQNWVFADDAGDIGWSTRALVPWRSPACYAFNAVDAPDGLAPFFIAPGDGSCEWEGFLDPQFIPAAQNPETGFLATANADPVGVTFDGDPLDGPMVDGRPLYAGAYTYADGLRMTRIVDRLEALLEAGAPLTVDNMTDIQGDVNSNLGERLRGPIADAVAELEQELATPGTHPDLTEFAASLAPARLARLRDAAERLAAWSLDTPAALLGTPSAEEIADSAATSIFNHWIVTFIDLAFDDELAAIGRSGGIRIGTAAFLVLAQRENLTTGLAAETGEPVLCDDLGTDAIESCTLLVLRALDLGLERLVTDSFASDDPNDWRWGDLHRVTFGSLLPPAELNIPPANDPNPLLQAGYPRPGDGGAVDASNPGWSDYNFRFGSGPAMRHVVEFAADGPRTLIAIPGGASSSRATGFFRNLMDQYWFLNEYFELPGTIAAVIANADSRVRIVP